MMICKKIDPYAAPFDDEEKDLSASYERGEWKTVENIEEEKAKARKAATHYLRKNARAPLLTLRKYVAEYPEHFLRH